LTRYKCVVLVIPSLADSHISITSDNKKYTKSNVAKRVLYHALLLHSNCLSCQKFETNICQPVHLLFALLCYHLKSQRYGMFFLVRIVGITNVPRHTMRFYLFPSNYFTSKDKQRYDINNKIIEITHVLLWWELIQVLCKCYGLLRSDSKLSKQSFKSCLSGASFVSFLL